MKKLLALVMIFAMTFAFASCTPDKPPADPDPSAIYPIVVTDQAGRTVTIEKEPQKLVSSYYITTSLLIALDLQDKLVGIENQAYKRPIYSLSAPAFLNLPSVGTVKEFDVEGCLALKPDLVILPLKLKSTAEKLALFGIDAIVVNPENQILLKEMIALVGKATNTQEKANDLIEFISTQTNSLYSLVSNLAKPTVYLAGNSNLLSTAGSLMYQSEMISLAGATNVASAIDDTYWAEISYEQLLVWNPEYIIIASDANYTADDVLNNLNLANCSAVQNGRVYKMPSKAEAWDSPVPGCILGSVWLASVIHPDVYNNNITIEIIDNYYETFYDFKYSEK